MGELSELFHQTIFLKFAAALVALLNPIYGIPVFLGMTQGYSPEERKRTASVIALAVVTARLQRPDHVLAWLALPLALCYGLLVSLLTGQAMTQFLLVSKVAGGFSLAAAGFLFQGAIRWYGMDRFCRTYFAGSVLVNTVGYLEFELGVLRSQGFVYDSSQVGRFSGLAVDSNANAALLATAALCGLHLLVTGSVDRGLRRAALMVGLGWTSYLFLISYSRGALVAARAGRRGRSLR